MTNSVLSQNHSRRGTGPGTNNAVVPRFRKYTDTFRVRTECLIGKGSSEAAQKRHGIFSAGAGLIEVMIAASIVTLLVAGITSVYRLAIRSSREVIRGTQSSLLAEEGLEAVRVIRDASWDVIDNASIGTSYTLLWTGTTWALTGTPSMINGTFDRRVVFGDVYRNAGDDIADSGTLDTDTMRVDVTVSWHTGVATTSRTVSTYVGNLFE
jgi:hypothetical protein